MSRELNWRKYVPELNNAEIIACYVIGAIYLSIMAYVLLTENETFLTKDNNILYIVMTTVSAVLFYAFVKENK